MSGGLAGRKHAKYNYESKSCLSASLLLVHLVQTNFVSGGLAGRKHAKYNYESKSCLSATP